MFILNPEKYSTPTYRIGAFQTGDISKFQKIKCTNKSVEKFFNNLFLNENVLFTDDGRSAILLALIDLSLNSDDEVAILTTSGNTYIAKCVTDTIEKVCNWSMKVSNKTKAILVNHEFGIPKKDARDLKKYNLPIIEDCCTTFFTYILNPQIAKTGDYIIFSFPKFFPIQVGGLLVTKKELKDFNYLINQDKYNHITNVLSATLTDIETNIKKQISNYSYLCKIFSAINIHPRFKREKLTVPSVFMFRIQNKNVNLNELKVFVNSHGIQSSVFYGERSFFIPCNYRLEKADCDYFFQVINNFLNENG